MDKNQQWRVGAGIKVIEVPEAYMALEGFTKVHSPIHARAVIIEANFKMLIISLEMTSMMSREIEWLKALIEEEIGIAKEHIWVTVTHTFSSPHILPDKMLESDRDQRLSEAFKNNLASAVVAAVHTANEHLKTAIVGYKTGFCSVNVNRDVETPLGWWLGNNGQGISDKTVSVMKFQDEEGSDIAIIYHYAVQSSVLDHAIMSDSGKVVSSDLVGYASRHIEKSMNNPKAVALFLLGSAGDQGPIKKAAYDEVTDKCLIRHNEGERAYEYVKNLGEHLGSTVIGVAKGTQCRAKWDNIAFLKTEVSVPGKIMDVNVHNIEPSMDYEFKGTDDRKTTIEALSLGELFLIGVQPELNCTTSLKIQSYATGNHLWTCTMVNGAAKYMADVKSYERRSYEAMNSMFNKGAAEILAEKAGVLVDELKGLVYA